MFLRKAVPVLLAFVLVISASTSRAAVQVIKSGQDFTGYAMGNTHGGSGNAIFVGDVAVHTTVPFCTANCIPVIPYGTQVHLISPSYVSIPKPDGVTDNLSTFLVDDYGDHQHNFSDYFLDIYFGRWRNPNQSCVCGGVAGTCTLSNTNSCTNAINFGTRSDSSYYYYSEI